MQCFSYRCVFAAAATLAVIATAPTQLWAAAPPEHVPEWLIKLGEIAFGDPMKGGTSPLSIS